ncbi:MAG: hypothetical protein LUF91_02685 [Oscillospiraceae bacterium]|nr:hypothetical protein [Oscillospiraceae bacterium]
MENWENWVEFPDSEINRMMVKAAFETLRVRVVDVDGTVYEGTADTYIKSADEEDEIPSLSIDTDDKGKWSLAMNEIKSIEILS